MTSRTIYELIKKNGNLSKIHTKNLSFYKIHFHLLKPPNFKSKFESKMKRKKMKTFHKKNLSYKIHEKKWKSVHKNQLLRKQFILHSIKPTKPQNFKRDHTSNHEWKKKNGKTSSEKSVLSFIL